MSYARSFNVIMSPRFEILNIYFNVSDIIALFVYVYTNSGKMLT